MTDSLRLANLTGGINAATNTFGSTLADALTLTPLQPRQNVDSMLPRARVPIDRDNLQTVDGSELPYIFGAKDVSQIDLPLEFKGPSANAGGAVAAWDAIMEQGFLLTSLFGAIAPATTNAATTCSGTAGATLTVASSTDIPNNSFIKFVTSTGTFVRMVTSGGGGGVTLTLDRAASGTASGSVIRMATWAGAPSVTAHKHVCLNAEWQSMRRRYLDCAPMGFTLNIPNSGLVEFDSQWMPSDFDDVAEANPALVLPTAGQPIVGGVGIFSVGAVSLLLRNAKIVVDNGIEMRATTASNGGNGVQGGVASAAKKKSFLISGECYVGDDDGSIGEINDDTGTLQLGQFLGDGALNGAAITTRDVLLQVGTANAQSMAFRMPAAAFRGKIEAGGAFPVYRFTARATGTTPAFLGVG